MRHDHVIQEIETAAAASANATAAMDTAVGILKDRIPDYTWVGIYLMEGAELVLGPYRGKPSPHTRIRSDAASAAPRPRRNRRSSWTT